MAPRPPSAPAAPTRCGAGRPLAGKENDPGSRQEPRATRAAARPALADISAGTSGRSSPPGPRGASSSQVLAPAWASCASSSAAPPAAALSAPSHSGTDDSSSAAPETAALAPAADALVSDVFQAPADDVQALFQAPADDTAPAPAPPLPVPPPAPPAPVRVAPDEPPRPLRFDDVQVHGGLDAWARRSYVQDYKDSIFSNLLQREAAARHYVQDYMQPQLQPHIDERLRARVVLCLLQIRSRRGLRRETLHLAVSIIDRYLSVRSVTRRRCVLLGGVALLLAAKFEEVRWPTSGRMLTVVDVCGPGILDNRFTLQDILGMETVVLNALAGRLAVPTPAHFQPRLEVVNGCDERHRVVVDDLLAMALLEYPMLRHAPSKLVSAAVLLSNEVVGRQAPLWTAALEHHSRYVEVELRPCVGQLRAIVAFHRGAHHPRT